VRTEDDDGAAASDTVKKVDAKPFVEPVKSATASRYKN
jgi:hypothetical protein